MGKVTFFTALLTLTSFRAATTQDWLWIEDPSVFNPSGLDIVSDLTQFQVLDWNGDALLDFMINEDGYIRYYKGLNVDQPTWAHIPLALPKIGFIAGTFAFQPKNFEFIDWDGDGDFDLAADDSKFWWNLGSNASPAWAEEDSILSDISHGVDFFFTDYDRDGDWDLIAGIYNSEPSYFFLNIGTNAEPKWAREDNLLGDQVGVLVDGPHGQKATFALWNADSFQDLSIIEFIPADPGIFLELTQYTNSGSILKPTWNRNYSRVQIWAARLGDVVPAYDLVDFSNNSSVDIVKTDWDRHIAVHLNHGTPDSAVFNRDPDLILGPVNVESKAKPVFFNGNNELAPDLFLAGDFLTHFAFNYFHVGLILMLKMSAAISFQRSGSKTPRRSLLSISTQRMATPSV